MGRDYCGEFNRRVRVGFIVFGVLAIGALAWLGWSLEVWIIRAVCRWPNQSV